MAVATALSGIVVLEMTAPAGAVQLLMLPKNRPNPAAGCRNHNNNNRV